MWHIGVRGLPGLRIETPFGRLRAGSGAPCCFEMVRYGPRAPVLYERLGGSARGERPTRKAAGGSWKWLVEVRCLTGAQGRGTPYYSFQPPGVLGLRVGNVHPCVPGFQDLIRPP